MDTSTDREDGQPVHTLQGLTSYLKSDPRQPRRLTVGDYTARSSADRRFYKSERADHLAGNILIFIPPVKGVR